LFANSGSTALDWFWKAVNAAEASPHGTTLKLIAAMEATVGCCCYETPALAEHARYDLDEVEKTLRGAIVPITLLRSILEDPRPERCGEALAALPFNYH